MTISLDGEIVLVTAAHVSDVATQSKLHIGVGGEIVPIKGQRWSSPLEPMRDRDEDRIDLAFWRLELEFAATIPKGEILPQSALDIGQLAPAAGGDEDYFVTLGYPVSKQPKQATKGELNARTLTLISYSLPTTAYRELGRDPATTLLLAYDKKNLESLNGPVVGPDLPGVSGGAVWYFPGLLEKKSGLPVLAALAIRWRFAEPKCVIATRIGPLLSAIRDTRSP